MDVITAISELLPELSRTQQRIAKFIIGNPDAVCFYTLKAFSKTVNASEATILGFCAKTEYKTFAGVRDALKEYLQRRLFWNDKLEMSADQYSADESTFNSLKKLHAESVEETLDQLNYRALEAFVEALDNAGRIYIAGHGVSRTIAKFYEDKLGDTGADAVLVDVTDYGAVLKALAHYRQEDVFILITLPFYSAQTVAIGEYLDSVGATVLAVTDKITSPIVKNARATLLCRSDALVFHNSVASCVALADILSSMLILKDKERFRNYNEKTKEIEGYFRSQAIPAYTNEYFYTDLSGLGPEIKEENRCI